MPSYKGHLKGGLVVFLLLGVLNLKFSFIEWSIYLLSAPIFFIYTLLPDIDTPASKIRKWVSVVLLAPILYFIYYDMKWEAVSIITTLTLLYFVKHRGLFHNPLVGFILSLPLGLVEPAFLVVAFIGFSTHLILDALGGN